MRAGNNCETGKSFAVTHYLRWACTSSCHLKPKRRNKNTRTAIYSLMENPPFSTQWYYSKKGFLYAAWNVHNIYTYYVKYIWIYCKWMDWYSISGDATVWKKKECLHWTFVLILYNRKCRFWVKRKHVQRIYCRPITLWTQCLCMQQLYHHLLVCKPKSLIFQLQKHKISLHFFFFFFACFLSQVLHLTKNKKWDTTPLTVAGFTT